VKAEAGSGPSTSRTRPKNSRAIWARVVVFDMRADTLAGLDVVETETKPLSAMRSIVLRVEENDQLRAGAQTS